MATEFNIYGSSRIGMVTQPEELTENPSDPVAFSQTLGNKVYEFSNHLGNVLTTFSDRKIPSEGDPGLVAYYTSEILSSTDYYPFGFQMPGRVYEADGYRYGFNGKEQDPETYGTGNVYDYGFRIYNPRIGKFLSVDPLTASYPWYTPYQFAGNMPIWAIDLDGLEPGVVLGSSGQVTSVNDHIGNDNYKGIELKTIADAITEVLNHKNLGNKIQVIYLQTHGSSGSLYILEGADGEINTQGVGQDDTYTIDDGYITAYDIQIYLELKPEERADKTKKDEKLAEKFAALDNFVALCNLIEDDGTLILGGCGITNCYSEDGNVIYDPGPELLFELNRLTNNRINIIANADFTTDVVVSQKTSFLDKFRTSANNFIQGWSLLKRSEKSNNTSQPSTNQPKLEREKKNLRLNSKGSMYDLIEQQPANNSTEP